ncbi:hypothetical protein BCU94_02290 [Shewanella sp. 10N.286.52.C2]|uniref:DUF4382 domain-containing protein n=1 Tax=Shewanella sp. 10N.286.52.C2 TaxID=1880838 RepID=UPI000C85CCE6|nr:DUF4382 domain-containing protein [Shewanella sp. 10N.286.52.C2]PMG30742.1 hypothetical protein BCU94_02290 [Shewanella sp. 10N.286.52.C2]
MKLSKIAFLIATAGLLTACGGSDSDNSTPVIETGTFNLGVSDNPADAKKVTIAFKQVVLKNDAGSISFDVSEDGELKQVDLLEFQGSEVETLVSGQDVVVGEYQMCIYMENSEVVNEESSYVQTMDEAIAGLTTNSNGSCGGVGAEDDNTGRLFFNKAFTIAAGNNSFVAEFNLQKGLQGPKGNKDYWTLKPTSVQLVNSAEVGAIAGSVSTEVMEQCEMAAGGSEFSSAVYLYPEATALENMDDFRDSESQFIMVAPIAAARVNPVLDANDDVVSYDYEFGFVVANNYSLGYTCVAQNDDPELPNTPEDDPAFFLHADEQEVIVINGETTERSF